MLRIEKWQQGASLLSIALVVAEKIKDQKRENKGRACKSDLQLESCKGIKGIERAMHKKLLKFTPIPFFDLWRTITATGKGIPIIEHEWMKSEREDMWPVVWD